MLLDRISEITQRWFLAEEALFTVFCTHRVAENSGLRCHARVGKGVIEVNPDLCDDITDKELEERIRIEVIRILLKHPYERQPEGCSITARALGSNCVIGDSYTLQKVEIEHPADFNLPSNGHFEFYARYIQRLLQKQQSPENEQDDGNQGVDETYEDIAKNWEQDELMAAQVNEVVRGIKSWGTLPGQLVEQIVASTRARVDYKKILAGFRASVISQKRRQTRMRPNRRSGLEAMGSRYDFTTRLIIGVDCSGSIRKEDLCHFYGTINRFFQYGIQQIDVIQFDTTLGEITTLRKASENVVVTGRGGTSFQPFINFVAEHPEYDGAIIYTDGYAPPPSIPSTLHTPLCWVLRSEQELCEHEAWMRKSGRVCVIENNS